LKLHPKVTRLATSTPSERCWIAVIARGLGAEDKRVKSIPRGIPVSAKMFDRAGKVVVERFARTVPRSGSAEAERVKPALALLEQCGIRQTIPRRCERGGTGPPPEHRRRASRRALGLTAEHRAHG